MTFPPQITDLVTMSLPGCDPGPLAGGDPAPDSELPSLKILVVDCKQGAVRAVR